MNKFILALLIGVKKLIVKMISNSDDVSHKRVISLIAFCAIIVLTFMSAYGHTADQSAFYILASLTGGESILSVIEKFKSRS